MQDISQATIHEPTEGADQIGVSSDEVMELARVEVLTPISFVVPTYKERDNLPHLVDRIARLRESQDIELELLFLDDRSDDGSKEWIEQCGYEWARLIERDGPRGLSPAVLEGIKEAKYPVVVVMDADLSHPPEKVPDMILALHAGQELVIGSRYVKGGSTDDEWGFFRWFNSFVATKLAAPLTTASDPMSGFFAFRKSALEQSGKLNPIGYKIGLEVIVKCRMTNVGEVPIHFTDRIHGESKLSFKEQLKYIQHLRRLYIYKYGTWSHLAQFLVVGASGVIVNLLILYALIAVNLPESIAFAGAIAVSVTTNFLLNRRFSFSYARDRPFGKQFMGFIGACSIGMAVQWAVSVLLRQQVDGVPLWLAAMGGIAAGTLFNFIINRYLVFSTGRLGKKP
jgi:dolichol-phosphate mannosyltransferase